MKVSLRGPHEKAFQMRCTVDMDTPEVLVIERVLQCVASAGIVSSVFVTTSYAMMAKALNGQRAVLDGDHALAFMDDLRDRLANRLQRRRG